MKVREGHIYTIAHKANGKVFYVGQTRLKPETRWRSHFNGKSPVSEALKLFGSMEDFEFKVIETVPTIDLNEREVHWIRELGTLSPKGLNMTEGGTSCGSGRSETTKALMSAVKKRDCADPEYRAKLSARAKAMWSSEEGRAKKRAIWTPERRAEWSVKMKAQAASAEWRKNVAAGTKAGLTEEAIEKKRQSQIKSWAEPGVRERRSAAIKAGYANPEALSRKSAAMKAVWARKRQEKERASSAGV